MKGKTYGFNLEEMYLKTDLKDNEELFHILESASEEEKPAIIDEIFKNNLRLVHSAIYKRFRGGVNGICQSYRICYDDVFALCCEYLLEAIYRFDVHRGYKFTTLCYKVLYNGLDRYFNRMKGVSPTDRSIESSIPNSDNDLTLLDQMSVSEDISDAITDSQFVSLLLEELGKKYSPRNIDILKMYITGDVSQSEIAEVYGVSQVQISRIVRRMQETAREIRDRVLDNAV